MSIELTESILIYTAIVLFAKRLNQLSLTPEDYPTLKRVAILLLATVTVGTLVGTLWYPAYWIALFVCSVGEAIIPKDSKNPTVEGMDIAIITNAIILLVVTLIWSRHGFIS